MNQKELIAELATKTEMQTQEVDDLLQSTVSVFKDVLSEGKSIGLQGFGNFEVRKKEERISVHPATKVRTLIPPKLVVNFKQSNVLKEKLKNR